MKNSIINGKEERGTEKQPLVPVEKDMSYLPVQIQKEIMILVDELDLEYAGMSRDNRIN